ncbi:MAG: hypothetical protein WKF42_08790 [Solirubrobacteraceae bacterium]
MDRSCRCIAVAATAALITLAVSAAPAAAQQPAAPQPSADTISVIGTAQAKPTPRYRKSNVSIRKAVRDARQTVIPLALADGRRRAANLSALSGLPLGALISIAEAGGSPFGFYGPFGETGTFGPDRYCGITRQSVFRRNAQGGRVRVGSRQRRTCRVPQFVAANLTMVFKTG